jgi:threonine dehydrogenase-like Zn-dependent dehydrogenase
MKSIGNVGFMEKPLPVDPGPNGALIKTSKALVCTSDVHTVAGAIGDRKDLTLGREAVGIVYKLGSEVKGVKEGDRVAVNAITPDYKCENCLRCYPSQCTQMLGGWKFSNTKDGVFAEYFHVNDAEANLALIPDSIPDETAVYATDMMSTGFMAAEHANIPIGGSVAIFGQGPVGLMATVGSRLLGAGAGYSYRNSVASRSIIGVRGFCSLLSTVPSLSKSQAQEVMFPVEFSINWTVSGTCRLFGER